MKQTLHVFLGRSVQALAGKQDGPDSAGRLSGNVCEWIISSFSNPKVLNSETLVAPRISEKGVMTRSCTAHSEEGCPLCLPTLWSGESVPEYLAVLPFCPRGGVAAPSPREIKTKTHPAIAVGNKEAKARPDRSPGPAGGPGALSSLGRPLVSSTLARLCPRRTTE